MKRLFSYFFFTAIFISQPLSATLRINPDTLPDTSRYYVDKSHFFLAGAGLENRNFKVTFKENTANLLGILKYTYNTSFPYNLKDWIFFPMVNQTNASAFITTKYGTAAYSRAIKPLGGENFTEMNSFSFSIPYKRLELSVDYLKFKGLNRIDPVYGNQVFLPDMIFNPLSVNLEYCIGKLKNSLLHVPKTMLVSSSAIISYMQVNVENATDFIPAIRYVNRNVSEDVEYIEKAYVNKFTSKGFYFGLRSDFLIPIYKSFKKNYSVLYLKGNGGYGLNSQDFEYAVMSDTVVTTAYQKGRKGFGTTQNVFIRGSLFYDLHYFVAGFGASFVRQSYGKTNQGADKYSNNHVNDVRIVYSAFLAFRINAHPLVDKIDAFQNKILGKKG